MGGTRTDRDPRAADPKAPGCCWTLVGYEPCRDFCNGAPRSDALTCPRHAGLEADAQAIKAAKRPKKGRAA